MRALGIVPQDLHPLREPEMMQNGAWASTSCKHRHKNIAKHKHAYSYKHAYAQARSCKHVSMALPFAFDGMSPIVSCFATVVKKNIKNHLKKNHEQKTTNRKKPRTEENQNPWATWQMVFYWDGFVRFIASFPCPHGHAFTPFRMTQSIIVIISPSGSYMITPSFA